jgi:FdhD protein
MTEPVFRAPTTTWRHGRLQDSSRAVPEETAIALTYDRVCFAVMMATPQNLADFAIGFSLSEHIIQDVADIEELDIVEVESGIECRMSLAPERRAALETRRRKIAGPVGCGLCGIDSLKEAVRPANPVTSNIRVAGSHIADGFARLSRAQTLNQETRAVHAAAFCTGSQFLVREDVGRHNALDKVIGAALQLDARPAGGVILVTSRVSIELIQKTATFGAPILAAISVPTARALRAADAAGITLVAVARDDGFEIFTHPERIVLESQSDVA